MKQYAVFVEKEKYIILYCVIMSKEIESSTIKTADIILASCVVAIIIVSAVWCCRTCLKPEVQPIRIEITTSDSLKMANYLSKEQADSLITIVKRHERELAERYQYALEQKMDQDQYLSFGTFLVGVVLSIFGFFGYKSIKSIEEKANKDAERAAKQTSEDVTKSYLDEKLDGKVSIAAEKIFNSVGADTMKAKVVEETIKHDDEYINSLIANLEKDLKEYIRQDSENQEESAEAVQPKSDSQDSDDSSSMF